MTIEHSKNTKLAIFILLISLLITGIFMYVSVIRPIQHPVKSIKIEGTWLTPPQVINDFSLTDNRGKPFTKNNLKNHWTMMFFGFTNCGMVCPTTLDALNKMYQQLQKEISQDQLPQIVFVTVDPDRDSQNRMNDYINAFNSHFIGIRSNIENTVSLENQLHIVAAKIQVDNEGKNHYTIDHSAEILLFNPNAELQALFSYPHLSDQMVKDYQLILSTEKA